MNVWIAATGVLMLAAGSALGGYVVMLGELLLEYPGAHATASDLPGLSIVLGFTTNLTIFAAALFLSGAILILAAREATTRSEVKSSK